MGSIVSGVAAMVKAARTSATDCVARVLGLSVDGASERRVRALPTGRSITGADQSIGASFFARPVATLFERDRPRVFERCGGVRRWQGHGGKARIGDPAVGLALL